MKFTIESVHMKNKKRTNWHKKFVIFPRYVGIDENGKSEYRYMETVYRKGKYYCGYASEGWEYQYLSKEAYEEKYNA